MQSVETAFSDLHRRYEKTKSVMEGFKQVSLNELLLLDIQKDLDDSFLFQMLPDDNLFET